MTSPSHSQKVNSANADDSSRVLSSGALSPERLPEQLLGYLLGALDQEEQDQVEHELQRNPDLKRKLLALSSVLKPLEHDREHAEYEPPAGLAARTCEWLPVATNPRAGKVELPKGRRLGEPRGLSRLSLADVVVSAGVLLAATVLFFPALSNSRQQAHRIACQENLQQLGSALESYRNVHQTLPSIPTSGNRSVAGIYAPVLHREGAGWIANPRVLICPSSQYGNQKGQWRGIPSLSEVDAASGTQLTALQRDMGGSYGYNLGYHVKGRYSAPKNNRSPEFALMSDAPNLERADSQSDNHSGRGQNVLFADGHIQFLMKSVAGRLNDDIFRNGLNRVAPGLDEDDAVIGRSESAPFDGK